MSVKAKSTAFGTVALPWSRYRRLPDRKADILLQEPAVCPLCARTDHRPVQTLEGIQAFQDRNGENRFDHCVVHCLHCGTLYTSPWFTREGFQFLMEKAGASYGACDPQERVAWLLDACPGIQSVLDIGCGDGLLLSSLPDGLLGLGIETDPALIEKGKRLHPDVRFYHQDIESSFDCPPADVVTLFHLLEHVKDPAALLNRLRRNAREPQQLVVEVPILDRAVECQGPDLCGFFSIPHRTHFSRNTLRRLLAATGWKIMRETDLEGNGFRVLTIPAAPRPSTPGNLAQEMEEDQRILHHYLEVHRESLNRARHRAAMLPPKADLIIWGAGHHTELLDRQTGLFAGKQRFLIVDRDPLKHGTTLHGIPVLSPQEIPQEVWNSPQTWVAVSSYAWQKAIAASALELGACCERILCFYPFS